MTRDILSFDYFKPGQEQIKYLSTKITIRPNDFLNILSEPDIYQELNSIYESEILNITISENNNGYNSTKKNIHKI